jgi:hypothetical protein
VIIPNVTLVNRKRHTSKLQLSHVMFAYITAYVSGLPVPTF